jgi:hypothetical protein
MCFEWLNAEIVSRVFPYVGSKTKKKGVSRCSAGNMLMKKQAPFQGGFFFFGILCHIIIQCSTERFQSLKWYAYIIQSSTRIKYACQSDPLAFALPSKIMWWVSCVSCSGETSSQEIENNWTSVIMLKFCARHY